MITSEINGHWLFLYPGRTSVVSNTGRYSRAIFLICTQAFSFFLFTAPVGLKASLVRVECIIQKQRLSYSLVWWGPHPSHLVLRLAPEWQGFNCPYFDLGTTIIFLNVYSNPKNRYYDLHVIDKNSENERIKWLDQH